jgi:hypothetical protein
MNARMFPALALCLFAGTAFAADPNLGTWKLNEGKSKMPAVGVKNTSVVYEQAGDSMKATVEGVDADGKPAHNEWTGKADGKDYPVTGDPSTDTRSLKRVDDHNYQVTNKKGGKVTVNGKVVFAKDFKTRTLTLSGKDAKGKPVTGTWVYDKQ